MQLNNTVSQKMKSLKKTPPRERLFAQRYKEEDGEIFVALYQCEARLLLVTSKERGGDLEVELSRDDALELLSALQRGLKKEANQTPEPTAPSGRGSS